MESVVHAGTRLGSNHRMVQGLPSMMARADELRARILEMVAEYQAEAFGPGKFVPGTSTVPVAGRVFDAADMQSLVDSSLDFWLTTGRFAAQFERSFARYIGVRGATLVN